MNWKEWMNLQVDFLKIRRKKVWSISLHLALRKIHRECKFSLRIFSVVTPTNSSGNASWMQTWRLRRNWPNEKRNKPRCRFSCSATTSSKKFTRNTTVIRRKVFTSWRKSFFRTTPRRCTRRIKQRGRPFFCCTGRSEIRFFPSTAYPTRWYVCFSFSLYHPGEKKNIYFDIQTWYYRNRLIINKLNDIWRGFRR